MQLPSTVADAIGWLAYQFAEFQPYIPTYSHLIVSALFPIYAGAHASLSRPSSAAKRVQEKLDDKKTADDDVDDNEEEEDKQLEGLSPSDAIMFPIMAGCTLAGLYAVIKWLNNLALLNKILNYYFATFGIFSVARMASDGLDVFHSMLFPHEYVDGGLIYQVKPKDRRALPSSPASGTPRKSPLPGAFSRIPLPQFLLKFFWTLVILPNERFTVKSSLRGIYSTKFRLGIHGLEGLLIGLVSVYYFTFVSKPWWLTNVMGFGFAYGALQLMSPTTFWTGTLILSGLFFYDIYFVFYTPMMVTVAKSLEIPVKLLFPRPSAPGADPTVQALSMLGLGDVVLPGIMIGLALRFDLFLHYLRKQKRTSVQESSAAVAVNENDSNVTSTETVTAQAQREDNSNAAENIVKAAYVSVAETLGDHFWTSRILFSNVPKDFSPRGSFPKTYFHASLVGYVLGMITTLMSMHISNHPQPALLYLVPSVLTSMWGTAWVRGEAKQMWDFTEATEDDEQKKKEEQDNKSAKKERKRGDESKDSSSTDESSEEAEKTVTELGNERPKTSSGKAKEKLFTFSIIAPPIVRKGANDNAGQKESLMSTANTTSFQEGSAKSDQHLEKRRRVR